MKEWKGYANVGDINNDPQRDCPLFERRSAGISLQDSALIAPPAKLEGIR
jgi:hypothetical protein